MVIGRIKEYVTDYIYLGIENAKINGKQKGKEALIDRLHHSYIALLGSVMKTQGVSKNEDELSRWNGQLLITLRKRSKVMQEKVVKGFFPAEILSLIKFSEVTTWFSALEVMARKLFQRTPAYIILNVRSLVMVTSLSISMGDFTKVKTHSGMTSSSRYPSLGSEKI